LEGLSLTFDKEKHEVSGFEKREKETEVDSEWQDTASVDT